MTEWGDRIKAELNLREMIEDDLGAPVRKSGAWEFWVCPFHSESDASFAVKDGSYHCFGCDKSGDAITWLTEYRGLDYKDIGAMAGEQNETERRLRRIEYEQRKMKRRQDEQEKRLSALEYMARCLDWKVYHAAMQEQHREYWYSEGIHDEAIERYNLGYCAQCPTDNERRASYTIPVFAGGSLRNIRHRLVGANNGDKYRPHRAGLGSMLFNADSITKGARVIVWEGEKKTIVMSQYIDGAHVGTMGKRSWKNEWSRLLLPCSEVIVALDPDAIESAYKLAGLLRDAGARLVRVAHFPVKPDDAVNIYAATMPDIEYILRTARSV